MFNWITINRKLIIRGPLKATLIFMSYNIIENEWRMK